MAYLIAIIGISTYLLMAIAGVIIDLKGKV